MRVFHLLSVKKGIYKMLPKAAKYLIISHLTNLATNIFNPTVVQGGLQQSYQGYKIVRAHPHD